MFWRLVSYSVPLCAIVRDDCSVESVSLVSTLANVAIVIGSVRRYRSRYSDEEYIFQHIHHLDACRFSMIPVGQALMVKVGKEQGDTAYSR